MFHLISNLLLLSPKLSTGEQFKRAFKHLSISHRVSPGQNWALRKCLTQFLI